jgi:hypothetical protein
MTTILGGMMSSCAGRASLPTIRFHTDIGRPIPEVSGSNDNSEHDYDYDYAHEHEHDNEGEVR